MALAALAAATAIAACGSSSPSASVSAGANGPTQAQQQQAQQAAVRFARCMRSHGVSGLPDPTSPQDFKATVASKQHLPGFQSAANVCRHLLGGAGTPAPTPAQTHRRIVAGLAFARCLRSHGFPNFPDPNRAGDLSHEMLAGAGINIHQPAVVQAADACVGVTDGLITRAAVARFVAGH